MVAAPRAPRDSLVEAISACCGAVVACSWRVAGEGCGGEAISWQAVAA